MVSIGHSNGLKILNNLQKQIDKKTRKDGQTVILEFEVPLPERDTVDLELVFSAGDSNAYEFMSSFGDVMQYFADNFKFYPLYYSNSLKDLNMEDYKDQSECLDLANKICLLTEENPKAY